MSIHYSISIFSFPGCPQKIQLLASLCLLKRLHTLHSALQKPLASRNTQLHNSKPISRWNLAGGLRPLMPPISSLRSTLWTQCRCQPLACVQNHQMTQRAKHLQMLISQQPSFLQNFRSSHPVATITSGCFGKYNFYFSPDFLELGNSIGLLQTTPSYPKG